MINAFASAILISALVMSTPVQVIPQKLGESQEPSALLARPTLTCNRGESHPGLHLRITNNGSSSIAAETRIRYSYQLSPGLGGDDTLQLVKPLPAGQSFQVAVDGVKRNSFQACTASVVPSSIKDRPPVIKLPIVLAPRQ